MNLRKGSKWCWPLPKYILMRLPELALQVAAGWRQPSKPSSTLGATTATTAGTSSNYRHPLNQQPKDGEIAPKSICPTTENKNWSTHEVTTTGRSFFYRHPLKKGAIKVKARWPKKHLACNRWQNLQSQRAIQLSLPLHQLEDLCNNSACS